MNRTYREATVEGLVRSVSKDADDELIVFNPSPRLLEAVITVLHEDTPEISADILATATNTDRVTGGFVTPTRIQELIDREALSLHVIETNAESTFIVTGDLVFLPVLLDGVYGMSATDPEMSGAFTEYFDGLVATADPISIRTPGLGTIRSTLTAEFGADIAEDFEQAVRAAGEQPDPVDPVAIALLIGAQHELLLYDLGHWGEDIGLASKASFSRTKTRLEEQGLLATEKVPIDIGRPRLRLKFGRVFSTESPESAELVHSLS